MNDERPTEHPDQPIESIGETPAAETPAADTTADAAAEAADTAAGTGYDQSSDWSTFQADADAESETAGAKMVSQLQAMIDSIATQATPVARQIGLKAAELTALAADRAGPLAHKAGDAAADVSGKLAVRSREFADAMRRELGASDGTPSGDAPEGDVSASATAVLDRPEDAAESVSDQIEENKG
jgi:hypothetical protein